MPEALMCLVPEDLVRDEFHLFTTPVALNDDVSRVPEDLLHLLHHCCELAAKDLVAPDLEHAKLCGRR